MVIFRRSCIFFCKFRIIYEQEEHQFRWGGVKGKVINIFHEIIGLDNLFSAWFEFRRGKRKRPDVQEFEFNLEDNLFKLYNELKNKSYKHGSYRKFLVRDPKLRVIHKASVRDRILHHAVFRALCSIFDKSFIFDSYSCRIGKGTHRAVFRLQNFAKKLSKNNGKIIYALKCDVHKFFDSINHKLLLELIGRKIEDTGAVWLIENIIKSFGGEDRNGLPLGNVTSQLFANIYLNELDRFIKHQLKIKYYVRYSDDFVILDKNKEVLEFYAKNIDAFLNSCLRLAFSGRPVIRKFTQGIDFLGYVVLPHYIVLRTKTKRRIFRKLTKRVIQLKRGLITKESLDSSLQSYFGVLSHCKGFKIKKKILSLRLDPTFGIPPL